MGGIFWMFNVIVVVENLICGCVVICLLWYRVGLLLLLCEIRVIKVDKIWNKDK